jgi:hypothetical protein
VLDGVAACTTQYTADDVVVVRSLVDRLPPAAVEVVDRREGEGGIDVPEAPTAAVSASVHSHRAPATARVVPVSTGTPRSRSP